MPAVPSLLATLVISSACTKGPWANTGEHRSVPSWRRWSVRRWLYVMLLCLPWGGPGYFPLHSPLAGQRPPPFLPLALLLEHLPEGSPLSLPPLPHPHITCSLVGDLMAFCGQCLLVSVPVPVWEAALTGAAVRIFTENLQRRRRAVCNLPHERFALLTPSVHPCLASSWAMPYLFIIQAKNF